MSALREHVSPFAKLTPDSFLPQIAKAINAYYKLYPAEAPVKPLPHDFPEPNDPVYRALGYASVEGTCNVCGVTYMAPYAAQFRGSNGSRSCQCYRCRRECHYCGVTCALNARNTHTASCDRYPMVEEYLKPRSKKTADQLRTHPNTATVLRSMYARLDALHERAERDDHRAFALERSLDELRVVRERVVGLAPAVGSTVHDEAYAEVMTRTLALGVHCRNRVRLIQSNLGSVQEEIQSIEAKLVGLPSDVRQRYRTPRARLREFLSAGRSLQADEIMREALRESGLLALCVHCEGPWPCSSCSTFHDPTPGLARLLPSLGGRKVDIESLDGPRKEPRTTVLRITNPGKRLPVSGKRPRQYNQQERPRKQPRSTKRPQFGFRSTRVNVLAAVGPTG